MNNLLENQNRRKFFTSALALGACTMPGFTEELFAAGTHKREELKDDLFMLGPIEGFSPHIGGMLSQLEMMRYRLVQGVKDLSKKQLDTHFDDQANSIGALLHHLAAMETYYQYQTFDKGLENAPGKVRERWIVPLKLGEEGRKKLKGKEIGFYADLFEEVREKTREGFSQRDDEWFFQEAGEMEGQRINNFGHWFIVVQHEAHHKGQIQMIQKRV